ncbi:hypothetical protein [Smaragdicoccus niigatensis]|uniref:hypothetical protein n=1 Tax=Smaragdicoccus niigatensis TaxID=359359 RepID=UPI00037C298B|nr:hypothetical protein [Smaragdicoccus niigatensis]
MIRAQWVAVTATMAVLITGCGNGSEAQTNGPLVSSAVTVPLPTSVVELVDPGAAPRDVLTFHPDADKTQQATLRTGYTVEQRMNSQAPQDVPNPEMTIPVTATASTNDIELTLGQATCPEAPLNKSLETAAGGRAGWKFGANGSLTALWLRPVDAADDNARAAIEQSFLLAVQYSMSLPGEAVGVGAMWRVRRDVLGTMPVQQITEVTLVERAGDQLTLDIHVVQEPRSSVWNLPDGQGTLKIDKYSMTGGGRVILDLSQPVPVEAHLTLTGEESYVDPNGTNSLRQTSTTRVGWDRQ